MPNGGLSKSVSPDFLEVPDEVAERSVCRFGEILGHSRTLGAPRVRSPNSGDALEWPYMYT